MSDVLVSFEDNWADEMDICGWNIMTEEDKDEYFSDFKKIFDERGYYNFSVGTNEDIEYDSFKDFKSHFKIKKLTDEESKIICKVFRNIDQGFFPDCD